MHVSAKLQMWEQQRVEHLEDGEMLGKEEGLFQGSLPLFGSWTLLRIQ